MFSIHKYKLDVNDTQFIKMPYSPRILSVQMLDGFPHLWALVNADEVETEVISINMYGTGHPIESNLKDRLQFIDTFQMNNGMLVFHVFRL